MSDAGAASVHDELGDGFFVDLVGRFYDAVSTDPVLRPLYPEQLDESIRDLTEFLIQYWGGATTYSDRKGHPRLRMRHAPFDIGPAERDAWLAAMRGALETTLAAHAVAGPTAERLGDYFVMAAEAMRNRD